MPLVELTGLTLYVVWSVASTATIGSLAWWNKRTKDNILRRTPYDYYIPPPNPNPPESAEDQLRRKWNAEQLTALYGDPDPDRLQYLPLAVYRTHYVLRWRDGITLLCRRLREHPDFGPHIRILTFNLDQFETKDNLKNPKLDVEAIIALLKLLSHVEEVHLTFGCVKDAKTGKFDGRYDYQLRTQLLHGLAALKNIKAFTVTGREKVTAQHCDLLTLLQYWPRLAARFDTAEEAIASMGDALRVVEEWGGQSRWMWEHLPYEQFDQPSSPVEIDERYRETALSPILKAFGFGDV